MAASITANPIIVRVGSGQQSGPTTISWDTGAPNIRGRVFVLVNPSFLHPTPEQLFDGNPQTWSPRGTKARTVRPGETHVFRLKQVNAQNTVLASVTVKGQGVFTDANAEPTVQMVDVLLGHLAAAQAGYPPLLQDRSGRARFLSRVRGGHEMKLPHRDPDGGDPLRSHPRRSRWRPK
jgi:hypothetical protein